MARHDRRWQQELDKREIVRVVGFKDVPMEVLLAMIRIQIDDARKSLEDK